MSCARKDLFLALAFCAACPIGLAQTATFEPGPQVFSSEGTDTTSGVHYLRLSITAPIEPGKTEEPPRFTFECREIRGKHDLLWFVSFGGVGIQNFEPPFRPTPTQQFPPALPHARLKMIFEGYTKTKPYMRVWTALPSGEYRYCNAGMDCTNMESARQFIPYLDALPGLRISTTGGVGSKPPEVFFALRPLLEAARKSPVCGF